MRWPAWLQSILRRNPRGGTEAERARLPQQHPEQSMADASRQHEGMAIRSTEAIMQSQRAFIQRIKLSYGSDHETFQRELIPPIRKFIDYVLDLPATPNQHFCASGGMVDLGLRTAFFALQATDDQIFEGRATISARRHLEPRWRRATFIAGLCAELYRTLSHIRVSDEHGEQWQPFLMPLAQWAARRQARHLVVRWEHGMPETRSVGLFALPMIITPETMAYLAEGNSVVIPHMLAAISGSTTRQQQNLVDELVRRAAAFVIDKNLQESARIQGALKLALHLGRYFLDTMKDLVDAHPGWVPNSEKSRVWFGPDGVFIVWPNAVADILKVLEEALLPGLPQSANEVLDILLANGIAQPRDEVQLTWLIKPPNVASALEAVRLDSPGLLFEGMVPQPVPLAMPLAVTAKGSRPPAPPAPVPGAAQRSGQNPKPSSSDGAKTSAPVQHLRLAADNTAARPAPVVPITSGSKTAGVEDLFSGIEPGRERAPNGMDDMPPAAGTVEAIPAGQNDLPGPEIEMLSFAAPMRLHPALVKAVADILHTLNLPVSRMACLTTSEGVFIPLGELAQRQIDIQTAIRSMTELGMLVRQRGKGTTINLPFRGKTVPGVVLKPACVNGLHVEDFKDPDAEE